MDRYDEAKEAYKKAVELYEELAKDNPTVYADVLAKLKEVSIMENKEVNEMKGRKIEDVEAVQVVIAFADKNGYVVPLTGLQGAVLLKTFGFKINEETGELTHYTDNEISEVFNLT